MSGKEKSQSWVQDLNLSPEDHALALRVEAGDSIEWEIKNKDSWKGRYSIDPWPLREISKDPDAYQKLLNDIDSAIRKNILEWHGGEISTQPRVKTRKVVLGGFESKQCSACLSLNPPYIKYCGNCGAHFR
jgi:hypothetical protein